MNQNFKNLLKDPRSKILVNILGENLYAVGGCLRDVLLGLPHKDLDFSVNFPPLVTVEKLEAQGLRVIPTGLQHQTVMVVIDGFAPVEITSFRNAEMSPEKGEHIGKSIEEDLLYRDFTCNALALNISSGRLVDIHNSEADIQNRILRSVGIATSRFKEDPLRILRLARLACQFDFEIEKETFSSAVLNSALVKNVSIERVRDEFSKILCSNLPRKGLNLLRELNFYEHFIPEMLTCINFEQNKFHAKDVYEHTLDVVERSESDLITRLASFFHDIGKPPSLSVDENGDRHFYLHEKIGAEMSAEILRRLQYSKAISKSVEQLVYTHMRPLDAGKGGLRRILRDTEPNYLKWRNLKEADTVAVMGASTELANQFKDFDDRIFDIEEEGKNSGFRNLQINGHDLIALGLKKGPLYKEILGYCQEIVIDDPEKNTRDQLIAIIKSKFLANSAVL